MVVDLLEKIRFGRVVWVGVVVVEKIVVVLGDIVVVNKLKGV